MNSAKVRLLLWAGCIGAAIYFAGDMLCYGGWGSGQVSLAERMARVALWRLHLCSVTAPVGTGFYLLGVLGLWFCCRRAAPRLAALMGVSLCTDFLFGGLWHGMGGPLGFAIQHCGPGSGTVGEIRELMAISRKCLWLFGYYRVWDLDLPDAEKEERPAPLGRPLLPAHHPLAAISNDSFAGTGRPPTGWRMGQHLTHDMVCRPRAHIQGLGK